MPRTSYCPNFQQEIRGRPTMINLDLLLKQNIQISNQLIQSLKVLSMSKTDLENFLEKEKEENVMVDLEESFKNEKFIEDLKDKEETYTKKPSLDFDGLNPEKSTMEDYLFLQLIERSLSADEEMIIKYLIYSLDSRGYLDIGLEEVAEKLSRPLGLVQSCQKTLLDFNPKGIGALNLKDCLLAQIQTTDKKLKILLENHLENIRDCKYELIMKDLDLNRKELLDLLEKLEALNPYPGSFFEKDSYDKALIPEIFVDLEAEDLNIKVIKDNPIKINQYYLDLLSTNLDEKTKAYLRNKLARTLLIKSSIDKRNETIEIVSKYLINYQKDYFLKELPLKPINQEKLALKLGLSPSTVSRAVREKYLETPSEIIPLQSLFSRSSGENLVSKDYIKKMLQIMIRQEDKKNPLSDEEIRIKLSAMDIEIKRRTVQSYRKELNIPSSYKRKRIYNLKYSP